MELDIIDGISFVKTLTRNVISLWDEVSTPRQEAVNLFSQSEELISRDCPRLSLVADIPDDAVETVRDNNVVKRKTKKRLLFGEKGQSTTESIDSKSRIASEQPNEDIPSKVFSILNRQEPETVSCSKNIYKQGLGVRSLCFISGLKNYTFPLYIPVRNTDSRLSSLVKALNLTGVHNNYLDRSTSMRYFEDQNNNSFLHLVEGNSTQPKTPPEEDILEFEKDIGFLSTVPNKTSTPIKGDFAGLLTTGTNPTGEAYLNSYAKLTRGLSKIFWHDKSPPEMFNDRACKLQQDSQHLPSVTSPEDCPLATKAPVFATEDEEAVYYLITKYLND